MHLPLNLNIRDFFSKSNLSGWFVIIHAIAKMAMSIHNGPLESLVNNMQDIVVFIGL